ncbi:MAG: ribosome small subunit-dependent GTPase A [Spirochaetes bacterium]|nr:ribosome small subunit-dependent GTPase A [Spirochaetota bacterium]
MKQDKSLEKGQERKGTVLWGANNIFYVTYDQREWVCYIKGKILKGAEEEYNPLAVGDEVIFEEDGNGKGRILSRCPRKNRIARFNKKGKCPQTIASNIDQVLVVSSPEEPPFRPRFIDRVCIASEIERIPVAICFNKIDLGVDRVNKDRLEVFSRLGYPVLQISVRTGEGLGRLKEFLWNKRTVLLGQSGTGKTSILNTLLPGKERKIGPISEKYNRGTHTTVLAYMETASEGWQLIDTPGVREFEPIGVLASELGWYFKDFLPFRERCQYPNCTHTLEPACGVAEAVEKGQIHPDRYESYLRLYFALKERERMLYNE